MDIAAAVRRNKGQRHSCISGIYVEVRIAENNHDQQYFMFRQPFLSAIPPGLQYVCIIVGTLILHSHSLHDRRPGAGPPCM